MTLQNPKAVFDAVRRIVRRHSGSELAGLTQRDVDELNQALQDAAVGTIVVTAPSGAMKPSQAALDLMHEFEGCRLEAYPDPGSRDGHPWTIGWGSTGPGIGPGTVWTQAQADERFKQDVENFALGVTRLLGGAATSQSQFDALTSFAYNVGLGALAKSTLMKKHKAGDHAGAATEFAKWVFNDGKKLRGLERRRAAEAALYRGERR